MADRKSIHMIAVLSSLTFLTISFLPSTMILVSASTHNLPIPYEGLRLRWVYTEKWYYKGNLTYVTNGTITYEYEEKISPTVFARELISPGRMKETVDVTTREILSGPAKGAHTSHWIRTNYSIGDPVSISDYAVVVKAKNIDINLPSVTPEKGGAQISCFELEYKGEMADFTFTDLFYYDMKTGIKVSQTTNLVFVPDPSETVQSTLILEESKTDNDEDGLTDLEELFVTLTNPLKTDSDYDFWSDPIDIMPNNVLVPNSLIVLLVVIPVVSVVWWWRKKRRARVEKLPTVPAQPAYPPPQLSPSKEAPYKLQSGNASRSVLLPKCKQNRGSTLNFIKIT